MIKKTLRLLAFVLLGGCLFGAWHTTAAAESADIGVDNKRIVEVNLLLEGETVPGKPKVVSAEDTFAAIYERSGTPLALKKTGKNTWTCYAVEGEKYVIGWIAKKRWLSKKNPMFGYNSEPFTASQGLTVTFSPGMPAIFEYDLSSPPGTVKVFPAAVSLLVKTTSNGNRTFLNWQKRFQEVAEPSVIKIGGIAGGDYMIQAWARNLEKYNKSRMPFLYDIREIKIKPGTVNRVRAIYPEIDTTVEEGDLTIQGIVRNPEKEALPDRTVKLIPSDKRGPMLNLFYPVSVTDANGRFEFAGVRPGLGVTLECDNVNIPLSMESLHKDRVLVMDLVVGSQKLSTKVGEPLRDIYIEWKDGSTGKISDFAGKVVVLDIWTTWCSPCLRAMPKITALAGQMSQNSEVAFIALSIDADHSLWKHKTDEFDSKRLRHGWFNPIKNRFAISKPVPYYVIVDEKGIIRCEGNDVDIGAELSKIL